MATKRIKDLTNTAASVASDAYLAIDGTSNGTEKITRDNFRQDTADAFVAAPGTYNLAPLSGGAVEVAKGGTGSTTAAGARTNLSVNSIDEDAQANALKVTAPALYFDGSNDYIEVADDDKLSFTDGTDDLPFSISAWVKMEDASDFAIVSKSGASDEWIFYTSAGDDLRLWTRDGSSNTSFVDTDTALTAYEGEWVHVAATYGGAGPNSATAFAANMDSATLFVNGVAVASTATNNASYAGMSDTSQPVYIGRQGSVYAKGHIRDCKIFNRSLTSTEVAELARGNDLGFSEEWGGALGANGTIDETVGVASWTGSGSVTLGNITETANTTVGGRANVLKLEATSTVTGTETRFFLTSGTLAKRIRVEFDYYIPSTNTNTDSITVFHSGGSIVINETTTNAWTRASSDMLVGQGGSSTTLQIKLTDGGVDNATIGDYIGIDNFRITPIGTLADFRAERYDTSTDKLYDISDNAFVGTGTSVTLTGREVPVYETGTWSPSVTFGGGSTGVTTSIASGFYTRIGNLCHISCNLTLTSKGTDTGTAVITGLPFTSGSVSNQNGSIRAVYAANMASLSSGVEGRTTESSTDVTLQDWGATGVAVLDDTNFTNTTSIRLGGWYQIQ